MAKTVKFPEAEARLFARVFICRSCGTKMRADLLKVKSGKIQCRTCKRSGKLRSIHRERKV